MEFVQEGAISIWIKQIKRQIWILENSKKAENVYAK